MGESTQTQTQRNDPWEPTQPHLRNIMTQAQALFDRGAGSQLWQGPTLAAQAPETRQAMGMIANTANAMAPGAGAVAANGGVSAAMQPGLSTLGGMGAGGTNIASYLGGMGDGGATNPHLQAMLDDNAQRIGNRVASQMSGMGRTGSFGHADALARSITAANAPILSAAYEGDQSRRLQAAQAADQTQLAAANAQLGYLGQGLDRLPTMTDLAYDPAARLAGVGAVAEGRGQAELDAQRQLFEREQQMPWEMLGRYQNSISGLGGILGNAGTSTGTTTQSSNPLNTILGLGMMGLGLYRSGRVAR